MNNEPAFKEYIFLVRVPENYLPEEAQEAQPLWADLVETWKATGNFVSSFIFPSDGCLVKGPEKTIIRGTVICDQYRLVSTLILLAADEEAAQALAKSCPVLAQGGMIEVKELRARAATVANPVRP